MTVVPLLIVHGSPIVGGQLEARVPGGTVWVLGPGLVVPQLQGAVRGPVDRRRTAEVAARVDRVLRPYGEVA